MQVESRKRLRTHAMWSLTVFGLLSCGAWLASFPWWFLYEGPTVQVDMDFGRLYVAKRERGIIDTTGFTVLWREHSSRSWSRELHDWDWSMLWGFDWRRSGRDVEFQGPLWVLVPIAIAPAWFLARKDLRARSRVRAGRCPSCGYDRRGLVGDVVCPECGRRP